MGRWTIVLVVAGVLTACFLAVPAPSPAAGPRPSEPGPPPPMTSASIPVTPAVTDPSVAVRPVPTPAAPEKSRYRTELSKLLDTLRRKQVAGHSMEGTLDEIGALLREHPGLIRVLVDAVPGSDRNFRSLLVHAVVRSENRRLRATLSAAIAMARDPGEKETREILVSSADRIAAAIQGLSRARDRTDLIQGLSRTQVREPRVLTALYLSAESDPDPEVRRASLIRLGKSGDPKGRAKVLEVLRDPAVSSEDRAAAALAIGGLSTKEDWTILVEVLRRADDSVAVLSLAANGLSQSVGRPQVDDVLFERLGCRDENLRVRMAAAGALALGGQRLEGDARTKLEHRAFGVLGDIETQSGSERLYAWSRSQFADSFGDGFRSLLQPVAGSQSSVSDPGE